VLLFVAKDMANRRKGFIHLVQTLSQCARDVLNLFLVSPGQNRPQGAGQIPRVHVGSVSDDRFLSMVYTAADLFAICSLQDNLPNTVRKAMACSIASVGTASGGTPDVVRNRVNGLTVAAIDVGALADAIAELLNNKARCAEMRANARRIALEEHSLELQARRYAELYASVV